jgi:shikimate dehydrogenase
MPYSPDLLKLALIGQKIQQSKSPFIHRRFGEAVRCTVTYVLKETESHAFREAIHELQREGFDGCNITAPFKKLGMTMANFATDRAKVAGSANTFRFQDDLIFADNTDGSGAIQDITVNIGYVLAEKRILILGAGGAARGILRPLIDERPSNITIANRTPSKALALAEDSSKGTEIPLIGCGYKDLEGQYFDVIIDGTSLRGESLPLPDSLRVPLDGLAYDLKYNLKEPTELLKWAEKRGIHHRHDGIGMLVEQAAEGFAFWTKGERPSTKSVLTALKTSYIFTGSEMTSPQKSWQAASRK